ncbi:MAG: DMT family transporter [Phycisphaerae bacterium]|nr:DMT family transporter [Phycisphaerae bacterium]
MPMFRAEKIKGPAYIFASSVAFVVMSVFIKRVSDMGIDSWKTTLFRFVIGGAIVCTLAMAGKISLRFVNKKLLLLRGLLSGGAVFLFFLSVAKIGLAKGTVLSYSSPIFACLFSAVLLRERISLFRWFAVAVAMAGVYFVAAGRAEGICWTRIGLFEGLAIGGAILAGLSNCVIKKLHDTDSTYSIYLAQCVMGIWIVVTPANLVPCSVGYFGGALLLGVGGAATLGQLLGTRGYRYLSVSEASLLELSFPVLNLVLGMVVWREMISFWGVLGAVLVLGACGAILGGRNASEETESNQSRE